MWFFVTHFFLICFHLLIKMPCRLSIWLCRRWLTFCVYHLVLLSWKPITMSNYSRNVVNFQHPIQSQVSSSTTLSSSSSSSASVIIGMAAAFPMNEMHKCPSYCRCELSLRKSVSPFISTANLNEDSIQSHSFTSADNYKVKVNCYRQKIRDLNWTSVLSSLTVQLYATFGWSWLIDWLIGSNKLLNVFLKSFFRQIIAKKFHSLHSQWFLSTPWTSQQTVCKSIDWLMFLNDLAQLILMFFFCSSSVIYRTT